MLSVCFLLLELSAEKASNLVFEAYMLSFFQNYLFRFSSNVNSFSSFKPPPAHCVCLLSEDFSPTLVDDQAREHIRQNLESFIKQDFPGE